MMMEMKCKKTVSTDKEKKRGKISLYLMLMRIIRKVQLEEDYRRSNPATCCFVTWERKSKGEQGEEVCTSLR